MNIALNQEYLKRDFESANYIFEHIRGKDYAIYNNQNWYDKWHVRDLGSGKYKVLASL